MKFLDCGSDEWQSDDWRWLIRHIDDKEFSLYEYGADGSTFVGDFPSLDLAKQYANHVHQCDLKELGIA
jgi:hypothetical protein